MSAVVVLTTASSAMEASRIARVLVEERLAACVSIAGPVRSLFRWGGKIQKEREWLLIIKSRQGRVARLAKRIKETHSYELPEVIALPVAGGLPGYLRWLASETTAPGKPPRRR